MSSDRTEQPTGRRLEQARKKGQIARTREAGQAASLIAATLTLGWMGSYIMARLGDSLARGLARAGRSPGAGLDGGEITALAFDGMSLLALVVGPIALASIVTALALHGAQGGLVFASEALHMNWGRLNPATGIKRLGLSTGGVDLARMVISVTLIGFLGYRAVMEFLPGSGQLARLAPGDSAAAMWRVCATLIKQVAIGLLVISGADYLVQRYKLRQSLRMTKQEVRDEFKMLEGNPEIKARVRRIQREMTRRRMIAATKKATVLITNPTHYAVALEYRRQSMAAPIVVAKGQDHLALRMRAAAVEAGVPIVENVPLARALYGSAEVGDVIPGALFEAVAEVLAYLIRVKQLAL
jgi:flagellar biosynthetic protein FlhB